VRLCLKASKNLGLQAMRASLVPPYSWFPEFVRESYVTLRRCRAE